MIAFLGARVAWRLTCGVVRWSAVIAATVVTLLWGVGRVITDSVPAIQWVHWIPTIVALGVSAAAMLTVLGSRWRRLRQCLAIVVLAQLACFLWQDWGIGRAKPATGVAPPSTIRLAHFNASWPGRDSLALGDSMAVALATTLPREAPDVVFLSECGGMLSDKALSSFAPPDARAIRVGRFGVVSRIPLVEARPLFDDGLSTAALVRFAPWRGAREWTAVLVDAPSNPKIPRSVVLSSINQRLKTLGCPPADMVLGDLNAARGGASIDGLAPGFHHAFDEAGIGYGATYPRAIPLWHIDHMLLSARARALRYEVVDLGVGKHRMQVAEFELLP